MRYFFDFDTGEILGVAKYWHEKEMAKLVDYKATEMSREKAMHIKEVNKIQKPYIVESINDYLVYDEFRNQYDNEYKEFKLLIKSILLNGLKEVALEGKWSIDIMIEGEDLYLIDMAKMENSALVQYMEELN